VFSAKESEAIRDLVQAGILERSFQVIETLQLISEAAAEAQSSLAMLSPSSEVFASEQKHINDLLSPNLLLLTGLVMFPRLEIYLRAISQRIKKLYENPGRDSKLWAEYLEAERLFKSAGGTLPLKLGQTSELVEGRWMLEEFRVNLFAQNLGTKYPVSLKRISEKLKS
jgi:ATP-dependent helicase HrpA